MAIVTRREEAESLELTLVFSMRAFMDRFYGLTISIDEVYPESGGWDDVTQRGAQRRALEGRR
jgi:hypothetical protein